MQNFNACVQMHTCVCVCDEYVCMLVEAEGQSQVPNLETTPTAFEAWLLTGLELLN